MYHQLCPKVSFHWRKKKQRRKQGRMINTSQTFKVHKYPRLFRVKLPSSRKITGTGMHNLTHIFISISVSEDKCCKFGLDARRNAISCKNQAEKLKHEGRCLKVFMACCKNAGKVFHNESSKYFKLICM